MNDTEFYDEPVAVVAFTGEDGDTHLQRLTWQGQEYPLVATGRQWEEAAGRHIMAEASDGTRFELQLRRDNLVWYVRRVWRTPTVV